MKFLRILFATSLGLLSVACSKQEELPAGIFLKSVFSGGALNNTVLVFKDGKVAKNPIGDLENIDFSKLAAESPASVGTYTTKGDDLSIRWGDGTDHTGKMKPDGKGGFDFRSDGHAPIKPLPGSAKLEGKFAGGASFGGSYASVTYTFDGKGGYQTNAGGLMVTTTSGSTSTASSTGSDSGSYEISGSKITFKSGAGTRTTSLYYVPTKAENPDMILIGGVVMTK